jgi:hypothetical protein
MSYITGTGNLVVGVATSYNASGGRSKNVVASGNNLQVNNSLTHGSGLKFINGEILSYITNLLCPEVLCSGTGKVDNLYYVPKTQLIAKFQTRSICLEARFKVGRGNSVAISTANAPSGTPTQMEQQIAYFNSLHRGNGYMPDPDSWAAEMLKGAEENPFVPE